jgi:hypothetical protein
MHWHVDVYQLQLVLCSRSKYIGLWLVHTSTIVYRARAMLLNHIYSMVDVCHKYKDENSCYEFEVSSVYLWQKLYSPQVVSYGPTTYNVLIVSFVQDLV